MAISEIKKGDVTVAIGDVTKSTGVYTVKYNITIKINGTTYSKTATQSVTVNIN